MGVERVLARLRGSEMYIWFVLLMWHAGQVWWVDAFETDGECQNLKVWYQQKAGADVYVCVPVEVEKT